MDELITLEGASQSEQIIGSHDFCNFSNITHHEHDEQSILIVWWSNVAVLPIIALIGLACNLLNMAVLTSNKTARRIPSWNLLIALAICDSLFLIFATLDVTPLSIPSLAFSTSFNHFYSRVVLYIRTLASTFYKSSVRIVVAFNIERYLCVVCPLNSHRWCTSRNSKNAIATAVFVSFLCSIQWPLAYDTIRCFESNSNEYYYVILMSTNRALQIYYRTMDYISLFAFNVLPIIALLYMNSRIIFTLRRVVDEDSRRDEETKLSDGLIQNEAHNNRTMRANAMLFAVVFMLFFCVGPQAPARLLFDIYGQYHPKAILYVCLSQQLVFLNASLNFCLYCVVSKRYRTLMKQTLKKFLHKLEGVDRPFQISLKQTKSSSAHVTSLEDHHAHLIQNV
uniref:CRE02131 n=1 Tax=Caenorhabditis remanei TaxID=31234 RepID=A0A097F0R4_CAERE|nr:CRE02131 [Caenorhabditis remanei]